MKIIPFEMLSQIPTGNPYKGSKGFVDIGRESTTIDIAYFFPYHAVDVTWPPSALNIRSHILGGQVRVNYLRDNRVSGVEILSRFKGDGDRFVKNLYLMDIEILQPTLLGVKILLEKSGIETRLIDVGFEASNLGISFFSDEYEKDLNVRLDAVTVHFKRPE